MSVSLSRPVRSRPTILLTFAFVALVTASVACEQPQAPPVKNAAGDHIESIGYEERFGLSDDVKSHSFRGERLKTAVDLMDKHGLFAMAGTYEAKGVDVASVELTVKTKGGKEHKIKLKNCAEPKVCAFFAEMPNLEKQPQACKSGKPCDAPGKK